MGRAVGRRAARSLVVFLALAVAACNAAASSTSSGSRPPGHRGGGGGNSAPARDKFTGSIVSATGSFSADKGRVRLYLHPRGTGQTRTVRVVIRGRCGGSARGCTELDGVLAGRLSSSPGGLPDTGRRYALTGAGQVSPLGHVTGRGSVAGTGFISQGHELIKLTLSSPSGSVTVQARSGRVKGFTSP